MSYSGKPTGDGLFFRGKSTSNIQDTWDTQQMSYTTANTVATLRSPFKGIWRLTPSMYSATSSGIIECWRPESSTTTNNYAKNGNLHSWNGGGSGGGDNSVCNFGVSSIGFYSYGKQGSGSWTYVTAKHTTFCEVIL